ncbi:MAG: hypothetical protein WED00_16405 [Aquisalimonadaceae bacterium]
MFKLFRWRVRGPCQKVEELSGRLTGTLMKFNRKTVTVVTDQSQRWNVSPHLLSPLKNMAEDNVIDIASQQKK